LSKLDGLRNNDNAKTFPGLVSEVTRSYTDSDSILETNLGNE